MVSDNIKKIVKSISKQGKMNFLEKTTKEKIFEFEKKHSFNLPKKYKITLR